MPKTEKAQPVLAALYHSLAAGTQPELLSPHQFRNEPLPIPAATVYLFELGNQDSCHWLPPLNRFRWLLQTINSDSMPTPGIAPRVVTAKRLFISGPPAAPPSLAAC